MEGAIVRERKPFAKNPFAKNPFANAIVRTSEGNGPERNGRSEIDIHIDTQPSTINRQHNPSFSQFFGFGFAIEITLLFARCG